MSDQRLALICGCSHTAGLEIDGQGDSEYNRANSFGSILADRLGYTPVNIALGGLSNPGILRLVQNWIHDNYTPGSEIFVIIGWTESSRMDVPIARNMLMQGSNPHTAWYPNWNNNYIQINSGWAGADTEEQEFIKPRVDFMMDNLNYLEILSANAALQIQYLCESLDIPYVMCDTMHNLTPSVYLAPYLKLIDYTRYMGLADADSAFYWYYRRQGYSNPKAQYWHHDETPHQLQAERLWDFLSSQGHL
jgi:hypothetical protein